MANIDYLPDQDHNIAYTAAKEIDVVFTHL